MHSSAHLGLTSRGYAVEITQPACVAASTRELFPHLLVPSESTSIGKTPR